MNVLMVWNSHLMVDLVLVRLFYYIQVIHDLDVNECEDDLSLCRGGTCRNLPGEYVCECPDGLELSLDGRSCVGKIILLKTSHT